MFYSKFIEKNISSTNALCLMLTKAATVLMAAIGVAQVSNAVELSHSYFGTLQYTQSTDEFPYSRFIDDSGTLKHNSLLGYQMDARISNNLAGTLQLIASNRLDSDNGQEVRFRQGFLGYEKGDWTLRAGRQRLPLYLDSRNFDVKHTYTVANLAPEVYLNSSADSYDGFSITKNVSDLLPQSHEGGYAQVTLYSGSLDYKLRSAGFGRTTAFFPIMSDISGAAFSANGDDWAANVSFTRLNGLINGSSQFGPLGTRPFELNVDIDFIAAGLRKSITDKITLTGEYVNSSSDTNTRVLLPNGMGFDDPSSSRSNSFAVIGEYQFKPGLTGYLGHYSQKGDNVSQTSMAIGARFDLDLNRSVKVELLGVNAKDPTGAYEGPGPRAFNIFSLSYNWAY